MGFSKVGIMDKILRYNIEELLLSERISTIVLLCLITKKCYTINILIRELINFIALKYVCIMF